MLKSESSKLERFESERRAMVDELRQTALQCGMVLSEPVLRAIGRIPRERFLPRPLRSEAYADRAQPIGLSQTISQPTMVAWMTTLLRLTGSESVLEIGTGSGYQALVLSHLLPDGRVTTVERLNRLARVARVRLKAFGACNVEVVDGDGSAGYWENAPYNRIIVTAAAPKIPNSLIEQLAADGLMVAPVGSRDVQELVTVHVFDAGNHTEINHGRCAFVPLLGAEGWEEP